MVGYPFVGLLFTGFMLTTEGPKVLEYNCRFGDPETQTVLPLLDDSVDLAQIMLACVERRLDSVDIKLKSGYSVTVVAASGGYPGTFPKNYFITLTEPPPSTIPLSPIPETPLTPKSVLFCVLDLG
jgi:phosphoribosylamine--glycine ligase / phosphoribosylformylglycinamidine cyclo-ligase